LEWYHQRKCDLSFPFPAGLAVPYYGVDNCETVISVQDFVHTWMLKIFRISHRNVGFLKEQIYSICQSGFRFLSWRRSIIYRGSICCTEQEFSRFYMRSPQPETTRWLYPLTVKHNLNW
jgi:hypothetical protein